jgi:hypothetical protein
MAAFGMFLARSMMKRSESLLRRRLLGQFRSL